MMHPPLSGGRLAVAASLQGVMVHPKIVAQLVCQVTAAPRGLSEWSSKKTQGHNV